KRSLLNHYTELASEGTQLILSNLERAAELVHSFKQVAVDQTQSELRFFDVRHYLEEVMLSLSPQLRQTSHAWFITGDESIMIQSYPGLLAQILTNLVTNSLLHGYGPGEAGKLSLHLGLEAGQLLLLYRDDGQGIPLVDQPRIFEPFFTTARDRGGTGLGLSILYNLVVQNLKGEITLQSQPGEGVQFKILLPLEQG
ncbi:MAG: HAMP domain-containing histidine kinase, partial [Synechococcales cyanobacterium RU_4_20]|nr:HAMP domain-containing histidine kinase [Synechococcales cyanobacterium RU_4_20]